SRSLVRFRQAVGITEWLLPHMTIGFVEGDLSENSGLELSHETNLALTESVRIQLDALKTALSGTASPRPIQLNSNLDRVIAILNYSGSSPGAQKPPATGLALLFATLPGFLFGAQSLPAQPPKAPN